MKKTKELLKKLNQKIDQVKRSKEFKEILEFFAKFHSYSFRNQILIQMQKPNASYVAGYKQWQDKFNRQVKKGEQGIAILAPQKYKTTETKLVEGKQSNANIMEEKIEEEVTKIYFKTVYVFDISQTEGESIPEVNINIKNTCSEALEPLKEFAETKDIDLKFKSFDRDSYKGYSKLGEIVINSDLNQTEQASTLVHELGHELLHETREKRKELTTEIKEMEAESVSFVVMDSLGVEIGSDRYLALYKKTYNLKRSLKRIYTVSKEIMDYLEIEK